MILILLCLLTGIALATSCFSRLAQINRTKHAFNSNLLVIIINALGRFLKGGIYYTRYNSYSRDKSAILGITITRNKNGFPEVLFILGIAIPGISLLL